MLFSVHFALKYLSKYIYKYSITDRSRFRFHRELERVRENDRFISVSQKKKKTKFHFTTHLIRSIYKEGVDKLFLRCCTTEHEKI